MTEHSITPPPELVEQWRNQAPEGMGSRTREMWIATHAARWGADQELEACCEWLANARNHTLSWNEATNYSANLRHARRPKPPSLKEQALLAIDTAVADGRLSPDVSNVVRRALEALPE